MKNPSHPTVKRLFALSANRCAFRGCTVPMVAGSDVLGEVCHIRAARRGGSRYDAAQPDEERHGFDNLILMCGPHNKIVDAKENAATYTTEFLTAMKKEHEAKCVAEFVVDDSVVSKAIGAYVLQVTLSTTNVEAPVVVSVGQSGGKVADQIARTIINNVPPPRSVDLSRMPAAVVARIKARPMSLVKFSHQDGDREAESFMRNMMSVSRSLGLPVDPTEGTRIGSGWIGAVVFLSKDSESADANNPLRVLAEWVCAQGHSGVTFNGREVDGVCENEIYIATRPLS